MLSALGIAVSPFSGINLRIKHHRPRVRARCSEAGSSASVTVEREKNESWIEQGNGKLGREVEEKKGNRKFEEIEALWDDGYGSKTMEDFFEAAKEMMNASDGSGSPRWFSPVECGTPPNDSPTLLYLPGIDGTGFGLILHHKALGKAFRVQCMHIPLQDRTPIEGLVKFVEEAVQLEHALYPEKPIYLVGDSFGACLALAVAARNPTLDLVLILVNPGTSFERSQLQPFMPFLEAWPDSLHHTLSFLFGFTMGNPVKMASVNVESKLPPMKKIEHLSSNLISLLSYLPELRKILAKDTLLWKMKLLQSAAAYANSRLHAVKAQVLVLASPDDKMLPSRDEANRLLRSLHNCKIRFFDGRGHTLLLEDGIGLLTIIKGTGLYRRSITHDLATDFIPPSFTEFNHARDHFFGLFRSVTGSVMFSTMEDGRIVKGLGGVPDEGPVLLVGYHNLFGLEVEPIIEEFLSEKGILVRGLAHPLLFTGTERLGALISSPFSVFDWVKVFGGVPTSGSNLYKLLSSNSHALLYPGGAREALHYKGERYKLIWPERQEFVRMAAKFGATIVPFGAVGEDDVTEMLLDYNDLIKIPIINYIIRESYRHAHPVRDESSGEVGSQNLSIPVIFPKLPGRFYYLFGKPIRTKGREKMLRDKRNADIMYQQVKSEVENSLNYLIRKREEDPFRNLIHRNLYQAIYSSEPPAFEP